MKTVSFHINIAPHVNGILCHTIQIFGQYAGFFPEFTMASDAHIRINCSADSDIFISNTFIDNLKQKEFSFQKYFKEKPLITEGEKEDLLGTAAYMIHFLQEYADTTLDKYGRFPFEKSYQHYYSCAGENLVAHYFNELSKCLPAIKTASKKPIPSRIYYTHDIDSLYKSKVQDIFHAIRMGRIDLIFSVLWHELKSDPLWFNIDKILAIEDDYDLKATFFWLVNKKVNNKWNIKNADYDINHPKVRKAMQQVAHQGSENGLHKSPEKESFELELRKLNWPVIANRYHFLKYHPAEDFEKLSRSAIQLDASAGFAENFGFRNSYSLPFVPYDPLHNRPFNFVEAPLHIMDRTIRNYMKDEPIVGKRKVLDFLDKHKKNCILSILWHNPFFTNIKFAGYLEVFKAIVEFTKENQMQPVTSKEIIENYQLKSACD